MKILKNLLFILTLFLAFSIFIPIPTHAETSVSDQYCENDNIQEVDGYWLIKTHTSLSQTFTPSLNRLTEIDLAIQGGADVNAPITMQLSVVGGGVVTSQVQTTQSALVQWLTFTFEPITIDTTQQYQITVTTTSSTANWVVSTVPCYAGGNAIINTTPDTDQDFGFATFGYNYVEPEPEPEEEPVVVTIAKPTSVDVDFVAETESVTVDWDASITDDITGYHVYRSEGDTDGFTLIGTVGKSTTIYSDTEIDESTTYYYLVKAYNGDNESESSTIVSVDIPAFATTTEEDTVVEDIDETLVSTAETSAISKVKSLFQANWLYIAAGSSILLVVAILVVYLIIKGSKGKTVKAETKNKDIKVEETKKEDVKAVDTKVEEKPEKEETEE